MGTTPFCRNRTQNLLVPKLYPTPKMALDYKGMDSVNTILTTKLCICRTIIVYLLMDRCIRL
ncbi:hypothetical protein HanIR_Chr15g0767021 [Helianthus annuus]|nr:hypothetical protein HanIR_Chr15g0767021 [Helianthus annuus]